MKQKAIIAAPLLALLLLFCSTPVTAIPLDNNPEVATQQRRAQVSLFDDALKEFGATSPQQAASLWAKGFQTRNGVYQYAVASPGMKKQLEARWGQPADSFYIIGGSSPWVTKYTVTDWKKVSNTEMRATVRYEWATSAGPEAPTSQTLTLVRQGGFWQVDGASGDQQ